MEMFDHGVFPATSTLFTIANLTSIVKTLLASSTVEYKITLQQWCEEVTKKIPTFTPKEAEIYFYTFKTLVSEFETLGSGPVSKPTKQPAIPPEKTVDMRLFAVYLGLQLYSQGIKGSSESKKIMSNTPWPGVKHKKN